MDPVVLNSPPSEALVWFPTVKPVVSCMPLCSDWKTVCVTDDDTETHCQTRHQCDGSDTWKIDLRLYGIPPVGLALDPTLHLTLVIKGSA